MYLILSGQAASGQDIFTPYRPDGVGAEDIIDHMEVLTCAA